MSNGLGEIHTCPLSPDFKFRRCQVSTCKFSSEAVPSGCLSIDRTDPDGNRFISDAEVRLYKLPHMSSRNVSAIRKKSVERIKCVLVFYRFVQWIAQTYEDKERRPFNVGTCVTAREEKIPYRLSHTGFKRWMWPYVVDHALFESFRATQSGECQAVTLASVLFLTEQKLESLRQELDQGVAR